MPKPSINADIDQLPMARGAASGSSPRSRGNVMPGANAISGGPSRAPSGGGTSSLTGIPSRTGMPPISSGSYMPQPGSPAGKTAAVTPGAVPKSSLGGASKAVLAHGRTLGAVAHLHAQSGMKTMHPFLKEHHAKATAGLASMKGGKKQGLAGGPSFGSMGGSSGSGNGGSLVPSAGPNAAGMAPTGMASLPDEM